MIENWPFHPDLMEENTYRIFIWKFAMIIIVCLNAQISMVQVWIMWYMILKSIFTLNRYNILPRKQAPISVSNRLLPTNQILSENDENYATVEMSFETLHPQNTPKDYTWVPIYMGDYNMPLGERAMIPSLLFDLHSFWFRFAWIVPLRCCIKLLGLFCLHCIIWWTEYWLLSTYISSLKWPFIAP